MKQSILLFLIAGLMSYGCTTSKKAADVSIGEWEYVVKDTPNGDASGTFTITKEGDQYSGILQGEEGDALLKNVQIENDALSSTFDYSGYTINLTGNFVGDIFTGKISVEGSDFIMTGKRKE